MKEINYIVKSPEGLHARPAMLLAKKAKTLDCEVRLEKGEKTCDLKRLLELMGMAVKQGDEIKIYLEGENEEDCARELEEFLAEKKL